MATGLVAVAMGLGAMATGLVDLNDLEVQFQISIMSQ